MSVPELTLPADEAEIEALLDVSFGPDRQKKASYRLREGVPPVAELCFVLREAGILRASICFTRVAIRPPDGGKPAGALLLGPLAVDPHLRGQGLGARLVVRGLEEAASLGHSRVILVGDLAYYRKFGFKRAEPGRFIFPGPVDEGRILIRELKPGAFKGVSGALERALPEMAK
jgi:predicted N-acetyltransferase YhbS